MKPLNLAPTPTPMLILQLTPGMVTMGMAEATMVVTTDHTDIMATMARDLPMKPLNLDLTPMLILQPTPGIPTMVDMDMELTGLTGMVTTRTDPMAILTGDKKWTSRTTSDLSL